MPALLKALFAASLLPLASASVPVTSSDAMPPLRFRRADAITTIRLAPQPVLEELCGRPPKGRRVGCASSDRIVMQDPCTYGERGEYFARILCHELAHQVGWSGRHEL
jgi:hypothetical protein